MTFKAPTSGLEDRVFDFGKKIHAVYFVKNCEAISKFFTVNYKYGGPKIIMAIKNMENPMINVTKIPEDTAIRVDIFIWDNKYKEAKRKEKTLE